MTPSPSARRDGRVPSLYPHLVFVLLSDCQTGRTDYTHQGTQVVLFRWIHVERLEYAVTGLTRHAHYSESLLDNVSIYTRDMRHGVTLLWPQSCLEDHTEYVEDHAQASVVASAGLSNPFQQRVLLGTELQTRRAQNRPSQRNDARARSRVKSIAVTTVE